MRIWLDDIRPMPNEYTHHVRTLAELKELLSSNSEIIEVMSFDHDLGDGEPDGYEIIKWLAKNHLDRWPLEVRVHSANPSGAANIKVFDDFVHRRLLT